jgi:hypothetical protein
MSASKPVVFRLDAAEIARLDTEAEKLNLTRSDLIRRGIKLALYEAERERNINAAA